VHAELFLDLSSSCCPVVKEPVCLSTSALQDAAYMSRQVQRVPDFTRDFLVLAVLGKTCQFEDVIVDEEHVTHTRKCAWQRKGGSGQHFTSLI
jgi:hypothetical protein